MTGPERTMIGSLQGLIASASEEQIYIRPLSGGYDTWLDDLTIHYSVDLWGIHAADIITTYTDTIFQKKPAIKIEFTTTTTPLISQFFYKGYDHLGRFFWVIFMVGHHSLMSCFLL